VRVGFLFWNLKRLDRAQLIASLIREYNPSVVALAESPFDPLNLLAIINPTLSRPFRLAGVPGGARTDLQVYTTFEPHDVQPVFDDPNNHISIRRLIVDSSRDLLVTVAHLQSKRSWSESDQSWSAARLSRRIQEWEKYFGHQRSLLFGDLNMNPFENGIVASDALHAVMTKDLARARTRIVDAQACPFFYNPMWRFFGERTDGPPGTHYYAAGGKPVAYFWNMFDQVLARPELMDALSDVKIVTHASGVSLLDTNGRPDESVGSDHLPLAFALQF
jgi:hypothetical protein